MKNLFLIPTYNEKGNIGRLIKIILSLPGENEVLVIDDNSPDGTGGLVSEMAKSDCRISLLSRRKKEGLGKAYLDGFGKALCRPEIGKIIMMDADFSHDPACVPAILKESRGCGAVIGSRYVPGGGISGWKGWRKYLSQWANLYCGLICRLPIRDYTAGFYVINPEILKQLDFSKISSSGYAFQIELKYRLWRAGAELKEFPIIFRERANGKSKMSSHIIREGLAAPWKIRLAGKNRHGKF